MRVFIAEKPALANAIFEGFGGNLQTKMQNGYDHISDNKESTLDVVNKLPNSGVGMDAFTCAAKNRIRSLTRLDKFQEITLITNTLVYLRFDDSACKIDEFGAIYWFEKIIKWD